LYLWIDLLYTRHTVFIHLCTKMYCTHFIIHLCVLKLSIKKFPMIIRYPNLLFDITTIFFQYLRISWKFPPPSRPSGSALKTFRITIYVKLSIRKYIWCKMFKMSMKKSNLKNAKRQNVNVQIVKFQNANFQMSIGKMPTSKTSNEKCQISKSHTTKCQLSMLRHAHGVHVCGNTDVRTHNILG